MSSVKNVKSVVVALMSGLLLSACGGEPSEKEITDAIMKEQQAMPEMMKGMVPEILSVKKIGCKSDGEKAYSCDVEMEAKQFGTINKGAGPVRLVKTSDGWAVTKR